MADVQVEHGYVRIANQLYEALARIRIPGSHHQVIQALVRLTYGYQLTRAKIDVAMIQGITGLHERTVRRALDDLGRWGVVGSEQGSRREAPTRWLNKDFETWTFDETTVATQTRAQRRERAAPPGLRAGSTAPQDSRAGSSARSQSGQHRPVSEQEAPPRAGSIVRRERAALSAESGRHCPGPTLRIKTKNKDKEKDNSCVEAVAVGDRLPPHRDEDAKLVCRAMVWGLTQNNDRYRPPKKPAQRGWIREAELMLRYDERDLEETIELLMWLYDPRANPASEAAWWRKRTRSPLKFRARWDEFFELRQADRARYREDGSGRSYQERRGAGLADEVVRRVQRDDEGRTVIDADFTVDRTRGP